jgi:hypothetical protein
VSIVFFVYSCQKSAFHKGGFNPPQPSKSPFNSPFFKGGLRGILKEGEQEGKEGRYKRERRWRQGLLQGGEREVIEKK